nr:chitobiase/beta-hexosaminidase C-terminal domain-containing protein [bacterium]
TSPADGQEISPNGAVISWQASQYAQQYRVTVSDSDSGENIEVQQVEGTQATLHALPPSHKLHIMVEALGAYGQSLPCEQTICVQTGMNGPVVLYPAQGDELICGNDIPVVLGQVEGPNPEQYTWQLYDGETLLQSGEFDGLHTLLPAAAFTKGAGKYTLVLEGKKQGNSPVSLRMALHIGAKPVEDIQFLKPSAGQSIPLQDVAVLFGGGDGAKAFELTLTRKDDGQIVLDKVSLGLEKEYVISKDKLQTNRTYTLEVTAIAQDAMASNKTASIEFSVEKPRVAAPIASQAGGEVSSGAAITLSCSTPQSKLYYTLDGTEPTSASTAYTGPVTISKACTLKVIAIAQGMLDSPIKTYTFTIKQPQATLPPIQVNGDVPQVNGRHSIFLSPSTQSWNIGYGDYGSEKYRMNIVCDYLEEYLKQAGVTVYRSTASSLENALAQSRTYGADLHLALHSNASNGKAYGNETWVDFSNTSAKKAAQMLQSAIMGVYYRSGGNNGVLNGAKWHKRADGTYQSMGETNPNLVKNGILMEIGFHDNPQDSQWVIDNPKTIAKAIAIAVVTYFNS